MDLFRYAAATSMAIDDPHSIRLLAALLGNARLAPGEAYCNMAGSLKPAKLYQNRLRVLRRSTL